MTPARALPAASRARCGAPSPTPLPTALTPAVGRGALKEHGCPCPALGSSWSGAPESQERSEGRVTSCRSPPPLAQCPALRRQLRLASTRPCLSPAGTVTGRSCHLDPGCPGSNETLRHGEEGVGAHGPGPTPGFRRRPQRPGIAGAPLRGPPPAPRPPPRDSGGQVAGQMWSPPRSNETAAAGHRARALPRTPFLSSLIGPRLAARGAGARAGPSLGARGPLSWARQAPGGGDRCGGASDSALGQAPASGR